MTRGASDVFRWTAQAEFISPSCSNPVSNEMSALSLRISSALTAPIWFIQVHPKHSQCAQIFVSEQQHFTMHTSDLLSFVLTSYFLNRFLTPGFNSCVFLLHSARFDMGLFKKKHCINKKAVITCLVPTDDSINHAPHNCTCVKRRDAQALAGTLAAGGHVKMHNRLPPALLLSIDLFISK